MDALLIIQKIVRVFLRVIISSCALGWRVNLVAYRVKRLGSIVESGPPYMLRDGPSYFLGFGSCRLFFGICLRLESFFLLLTA